MFSCAKADVLTAKSRNVGISGHADVASYVFEANSVQMLASQSKKKSTRLRSGYVRDVMPRCNCPPISSAEVNTVSNMSMSEPSTLFRLFRSPGNRRDSSRASSRNVSHVRTYCRAEGPTALRKRMLRRYAENKGPTKYGLFRKRNRLSASCCSLYSRSTFGMGKFLPYRSTAEGR